MAKATTASSTYRLKSGFQIPVLGYGVYKTPPEETSSAVQNAVKIGYRHVDSAAFYNNEAAAAQGLLESHVPRDQVFFTSKVPPDAISYDGVKKQIGKTIKEIGALGYIDLMLLHAPFGGREGRLGAWEALVEAVEEGQVKSIGVSNYGVAHLKELETYIKETDDKLGRGKGGVLSVNQIELHPWLNRRDIIDWCQERGVLVQAWAPLAQAGRFTDKTLVSLAEKQSKTPAQILLRWSLQKGFCPLPKSVTPKRIEENFNVFDFDLDDQDMAKLETDEYDFHGWDPTKRE